MSNLLERHEERSRQLQRENSRLEQMLQEKERKISESRNQAREVALRAEEFEELFIGQLEVVKSLQSNLQVACEENKALAKEMEMLNDMFVELERMHIVEALREYTYSEVDLSDASQRDSKGKVVMEVQEAIAEDNEALKTSSAQVSIIKSFHVKNNDLFKL